VIFPNKIDKIGIESKKKRSSRDVVFFFFMGSLKTEAYGREVKGKKENQTNTKSNIIIIYVPPKKKEKAQTHPIPQQNIFFPPL
jgi:hypothetical protein